MFEHSDIYELYYYTVPFLDVATETTPLQGKDGDGDVFMMLDLPLEREHSGSGTPDNRYG